jgi:hypothetical protein
MTAMLTFSPSPLPSGSAERAATAEERAFDPSGAGTVHWTATARSALRAILLHLRATGRLEGADSEVLSPRWVCLAFYKTVQGVGFPTLQDSPGLRGVVAYHQYGFPQRLDLIAQRCRDRGLFLIENCVNVAFDGPSPYGMGETGLASVFSLPKMFRTVLGGALSTRDAGLREFCAGYFKDDEPWIGSAARAARRLPVDSPVFHELVYSLSAYGRRLPAADAALLKRDLAEGAVSRRRSNYARLRREFASEPFFEGLESDVIPYVVPLFGPPEFLARLSARLSERGWESGVYRFDAARDVFAPWFTPCVPLPIHQGLTDAELDALMETVRSEWRAHNGQR